MEDATLIQMQGYFSKWISLAGGGRSTGPGWERGLTVVGLDHQPLGLITVPQETHNSWKVLGPLQAVLSTQRPPKPMSIEIVTPSNHLILCHPLLLLPSIFPSIRDFSNEVSSLHQVAKVLEFQLQHQSFQRTPRTDYL